MRAAMEPIAIQVGDEESARATMANFGLCTRLNQLQEANIAGRAAAD
jgi:hypothetical protein